MADVRRAGQALTPGRRAALKILQAIRRGALLDPVWAAVRESLDARERAWTHQLVYGTLRLRSRLDWELARAVKGPLTSLGPDVLDVLRLGVYQLREMGSVPAFAAISQSVELVRWAGEPRAAGLVNGVLRTLRRTAGTLRFPDPERAVLEYLSSWGSHPRWIVERWLARWSPAEVRQLTEANNRVPHLYLRPAGVSPAAAVKRLTDAGVAVETVAWAPDSIRLVDPSALADALSAVPVIVQDPAASWVARYAQVPAGARVLDLCAAPGGKALAAAESARFVVAADRSAKRLRRVAENLERLGFGARVAPVVADARTPPFRPVEMVLVDAPCTGTGTFARHPDARWRIGPEDLASLAELQRDMLSAAAMLVQLGGWLVYSTCSLEPEENELQVEHFLAHRPEFALDPPSDLPSEMQAGDGFLQVLPQRTGSDGSFAARLRRCR